MTCAKRLVTCTLVAPDGVYRVIGSNACENPQAICPRAANEGYTKCDTVCRQQGHAEIQALVKAKKMGWDVTGWTAYVRGHYYICEPCARALNESGITHLVVLG